MVHSLAHRIVDDLLLEDDSSDVSDFMKSYSEENPIGIRPSDEEVDEDRMLRGVKVLGKYYLFLWDTYQRDGNHSYLGYRFVAPNGVILFQGTDYGCPGRQCADSDETVADLIGWFILRPGDTDDEYFEKYTPQQLEFAEGDDAAQLALDLDYDHGEGNAEGYSKPWVDLPGYEHGDEEE